MDVLEARETKPSTRGLVRRGAIAGADDTSTKAVLVGAHLLAAAIIIPTLGRRLTAVDHDGI